MRITKLTSCSSRVAFGLALALTGCATTATPIDVARAVCPAPGLFEHAVCVCNDLTQVGELHVLAGPAGVGSVGVNGFTELVADVDVVGDWNAWGGFSATGASVGQSLITPANVEIVGDATIGGDALVGGDLLAVGNLEITGTLRLAGNEELIGESTIANRAPYQAPASAPPCGCDEGSLFDVATAVAAAQQATNSTPSWESVGDTEMHLATGSYYVTSAEVVGDTVFTIDGNVSVFVAGDLASVGSAQWRIAPGATLDLFVSGNVETVGDFSAGNEAANGAFRLYVGGTEATAVGTTGFFGSLYAPNATVSYVGDARIVGAIFARNLEGTGSLTVEYGSPVTTPQSCTQPPAPPSGPSETCDAGVP